MDRLQLYILWRTLYKHRHTIQRTIPPIQRKPLKHQRIKVKTCLAEATRTRVKLIISLKAPNKRLRVMTVRKNMSHPQFF